MLCRASFPYRGLAFRSFNTRGSVTPGDLDAGVSFTVFEPRQRGATCCIDCTGRSTTTVSMRARPRPDAGRNTVTCARLSSDFAVIVGATSARLPARDASARRSRRACRVYTRPPCAHVPGRAFSPAEVLSASTPLFGEFRPSTGAPPCAGSRRQPPASRRLCRTAPPHTPAGASSDLGESGGASCFSTETRQPRE